MMAFLATLTPYIPILLTLVGWVLRFIGANEADLAAYQKMIDDANAAGDLSIESHDRLLAHKKAIEDRLKAKQNG